MQYSFTVIVRRSHWVYDPQAKFIFEDGRVVGVLYADGTVESTNVQYDHITVEADNIEDAMAKIAQQTHSDSGLEIV